MKLFFNQSLVSGYKNPSQCVRVLSEDWTGWNGYCPQCGNACFVKQKNNSPVCDFICKECREEFELKSKKNAIGKKITDGEYKTMIGRLASANNPNFFFLQYRDADFSVQNFFVVPKHFFVPEMIEKRKPLAPTARRAGWVGCNILLAPIPDSGKIFYVRDGREVPKKAVLETWRKGLFLREEKESTPRGWLLDVMRCVEKIGKNKFTLDDVYTFEEALRTLHPENNHITDKIRQQLQLLRDRGYVKFTGRGTYELA